VKDLDRERQFHLDERAAELEAAGYSAEAARAEAARRFGTPVPLPPRGPERRPTMTIEQFFQDVRFTLRSLRRNAAFAVFATLIAGLGIGATTTVFSVVSALILRPLPFAEPDRLVWLPNRDSGGLSAQTTQVAHMLDLRARTQTMSGVGGYFAFYGVGDQVLTGAGDPERLSGVPVTDNFFDVLGVRPVHGRTFNADETRWQGSRAVMLSDGFWRRRFAADPGVVGRRLTLNDESHLIVGILPAEFDFATVFAPGNRFDLFLPFPLSPESSRWGNTMSMVGRLKPGVSVDAARAEVRAIAEELTRAHTDRNSFVGVVKPLAEQVGGRMRTAVWVLTGAVAAVMLIVCANLSNLLLARTASRHKEMAIRMAMGAGRRRLAAQMLTEGVVLALSGAVVGVGLAWAGTAALAQQNAVSIAMLSNVRLDPTALGFALALAMLTGILFGLAPALQAPDLALHSTLKDSSRGATEGRERRWVRSALVVAEITFACVLLVGAGLLLRSFVRVLDVTLGFDPVRASTIRVDPDARVETPEQADAYFNDVLTAARGIPGVQAAGITDALPFGRNRTWGVRLVGQPAQDGPTSSAYIRIVSDGYFAAMGVPLLEGRDFSRLDLSNTERVVIVNQRMAQRLWPDRTAIGESFANMCGDKPARVIGVVGDVRHLSPEQPSGNELYLPMRQCRQLSSADLVLRSDLPASQLASSVRSSLRPLLPAIGGNEYRAIQQLLDKSVSPRRFLVWLLGGFAVFAVVLASFGTYALISYSVNQRTREIGIRMALGASAREVQFGIIRQTLMLASIGLILGTAGAWALARAIRGLLFDVTPGDPWTFAAMAAVLLVVAAIAGYLPARRASRTDPLTALRAE
jgi:predicted permease